MATGGERVKIGKLKGLVLFLILHNRSELQTMSVNAQVVRLKKQLEDAERRQRESAKVSYFN